MKKLARLFANNRRWVADTERAHPGFFAELANIHDPAYLWIGCADSRVPANEIVGLRPGELFVHRNIANQVIHTDINCLSVIQYAVDVLHVTDIIVCGHYDCGGVKAAFDGKYHGLIDNWLRNLQEIIRIRHDEIYKTDDRTRQLMRLEELNVVRQALNVGDTTVVQDAWRRKQRLAIHGWIYAVDNGMLQDLGVHVSTLGELHRLEDEFFARPRRR